MESLRMIENWPVPHAAAAVVRADGAVLGTHGPQQHLFPLASVTKPLTSYAALVAVEEGVFELDDPAGPSGATVRHLLAHTSGLGFDEDRVFAEPGKRRLYSNAGFDALARALSEAAGIEFSRYTAEAVFEPLGMTDTLLNTAHKSPAGAGGLSTVADLTRFAAELQAPRLLDPSTVRQATREVAFPGTGGVLPGYGHHRPNDWGLGFEIRDGKSPHWTGTANSPGTFGHFGQSGTFLWVDPQAGAACVVLTDRDFGPWAIEAWPAFSDAVLAELRG
ncbi:serine hydrolase domain-containing protein [Streptomyces sp. CBMA156]|uniref:serine hydrolase domain-containing protein n=1 Tax=Streptomyces sp. CBMA156 TaxID=1930280 RepID=UPI001661ADE8|nr:serine hydrolase domain-containing protein [Streptomyces sp. CBMA156]MBD0671035.1 serine hydrolase [Streptomyces sp. CBMA156]